MIDGVAPALQETGYRGPFLFSPVDTGRRPPSEAVKTGDAGPGR
jgi:hypothetical protein